MALAPWAMNVVLVVAYVMSGGRVSTDGLLAKLGPAIGMGVMASLFEEPGWRGFVLPRLQERYRPFASAVVVGLVWGGIWHGYADYIGIGDLGWGCVPLIVLLGPVLLTTHSVLLTRIHNATQGSLLLCSAYHVSISSSGFIFSLEYPSYGQNLFWTSVAVLIAWAIVGIVVLGTAGWSSPQRDIERVPHVGLH